MNTFVIACKFNRKMPYIYACISSILEHQPDDELIIIDSNSDDKSYIEFLRENKFDNIIIHESKNNHYDTGAYWVALNKFKRDKYVFIHDGLILFENISDFIDKQDVSFLISSNKFCWPSYKKHKLSNLYAENYKDRSPAWGQTMLNKTNINSSEYFKKSIEFNTCVGPMFVSTRKQMLKLKKLKFNSILPNNKYEQNWFEIFWGIAFHSIYPDVGNNYLIRNRITKNEMCTVDYNIYNKIGKIENRCITHRSGDKIMKLLGGR